MLASSHTFGRVTSGYFTLAPVPTTAVIGIRLQSGLDSLKSRYQCHCQKPFTQWVPLGSINTNLLYGYIISLYWIVKAFFLPLLKQEVSESMEKLNE
jgi:hypothetical protein